MNNIIYAMTDPVQFSAQIPVGSTLSHRVGLLKILKSILQLSLSFF